MRVAGTAHTVEDIGPSLPLMRIVNYHDGHRSQMDPVAERRRDLASTSNIRGVTSKPDADWSPLTLEQLVEQPHHRLGCLTQALH
jgi:hypothetical protein